MDAEMINLLGKLDAVLEPGIALTLAGMSITVSIFLMTLSSNLNSNIATIRKLGGDTKKEQLESIQSIESATKKLFCPSIF